jgi:N6-adenosine-specific RNA methylase IME4
MGCDDYPTLIGEILPAEPTLDELAARANRYHAEAQAAANATLVAAWQAGRALLAAREQVEPDNWGTWLEKNFDGEKSNAYNYLALAKHFQTSGSLPVTSIDGALKAIRQQIARDRNPDDVPEPIPPLQGRYRCIIIDPPWPMQKIERLERPDQGIQLDYPAMELDDIADEQWCPVRTHADNNCHLYLWVTHKYLPFGLDLIDTWGFRYQCAMTWCKNVGITPFSWMYDTEHVLFATRGNLPLNQLGLRLSFTAPVQGHSVKPDIFYERVLAASPGPRVDMFTRRQRDGFDAWGNEVCDVLV